MPRISSAVSGRGGRSSIPGRADLVSALPRCAETSLRVVELRGSRPSAWATFTDSAEASTRKSGSPKPAKGRRLGSGALSLRGETKAEAEGSLLRETLRISQGTFSYASNNAHVPSSMRQGSVGRMESGNLPQGPGAYYDQVPGSLPVRLRGHQEPSIEFMGLVEIKGRILARSVTGSSGSRALRRCATIPRIFSSPPSSLRKRTGPSRAIVQR